MTTVKSIAVIGAGTMGSGIALTAAMRGMDAFQVDISADQLGRAKASHAKILARNVQKERMTQAEADAAAGRIRYVENMGDAKSVDWAVEAATENLKVKMMLFQSMRETFGGDVVLATNTSSISITEIAAAVDDAADRVVGMHFFNPVPIMKL
ncbi:MAG: 3-hydroxybutyryl-CoA dehydrogenase, partial [Phycisphaerales bacterium]|nr:3-hydroxybutyryl-CoA dehydrogenase [Phycisphaerales bacterium]